MSSGYDESCITLSQEGKIYQIEYAAKAVDSGCTITGLVCADGVILAAEKIKYSKTMIGSSNPTIYNVTKNIGIAICGYLPDGRNIVSRAQLEAKSYLSNFGIDISGKILSDRIANYVHMHTLYWFYRPFGAAVMISSYEKNTPHLYMVENDGSVFEYYSCSNGKGRQYVKNDVEKNNYEIRSKICSLSVSSVLKSLIKSYEGEKETEYDLSVISKDTNGKHLILDRSKLSEMVEKLKKEVELERQENIDN